MCLYYSTLRTLSDSLLGAYAWFMHCQTFLGTPRNKFSESSEHSESLQQYEEVSWP